MKRPIRRILSTEERKWLEELKRDKEIQLRNPQISATDSGQVVWAPGQVDQDSSRTQAQIQRLSKALDEGSVHDISRNEKAERDRVIRRLEQIAKKTLVPNRYLHQKQSDTKDYHKTVNEGLVNGEMSSEFQKNVIEPLKNLRRERDPENPEAGNIDDLRED